MSDEAVDSAMGALGKTDADKWEQAQSKAFLHWINVALRRRDMKIDNLLTGFESGVQLINFVEVLTGKAIAKSWVKQPNLRVHKITNCFLALEHLKECGAKGLLISAENIVNCDRLNLILGFCWQTLRCFHEPPKEGQSSVGNADFGENLLQWVKTILKDYSDIDLKDGYKSEGFRNGKVFAGLVNEFDDTAIDYKSLGKDVFTYEQNNITAFTAAETKLGIPSILEADQCATGKCNEKQIQLYLSLLYNSFSEKDRGMTKEVIMKKVQELEGVVVVLTNENISLKESLSQAEHSFSEISETLNMTTETHNKVRKEKDDTSTTLHELQDEFMKSKAGWEEELLNLKAQKAKMSENSDEQVVLLDNKLEEATKNRDALRDELRKAKEELQKEREELEAQQKKLLNKVERVTKSKQELEVIDQDGDQFHQKSLPSLCNNIRQHTRDLNPWANILEEDRSYKYRPVNVPEDDIHKKEFLEQMKSLKELVVRQNTNFEKLLNDRKKEKQEVISVAMGKLKKREKTKQEKESEAGSGNAVDDSDDEPNETKADSVVIPKVDMSPVNDVRDKEGNSEKKDDKKEEVKKEKRGFVKATSPRAKMADLFDGEKK